MNLHVTSQTICRIAVPVPLYTLFDYLPPENFDHTRLAPGQRVTVPFANRKHTGILMEMVTDSDITVSKLKTIETILDDTPLLSAQEMKLLAWAARYYHHPVGEVMATAFPVNLRKGKPAILQQEKHFHLTDKGRQITDAQLKRAPKQQALLGWLQQMVHPVNVEQLKQWNPAWQAALKGLRDKQLVDILYGHDATPPASATTHLHANSQQQDAITEVCNTLDSFRVFLLEGITGSGKTEVYMQIIARVLQAGRQVLVLLPEITLTPQLENRFRQRFDTTIVCSHSAMADGARTRAWLQMQQHQATIMLGTRSALFTPLSQPGLIILDEEHDSSFKQQEGFRYSARDVAIVRARNLNIPVVMGSATPSLESLHNVQHQRYQHLRLTQRAGEANAPKMQLLDIRNRKMQSGLSQQLINEINNILDKQEQVLLFINRRGYAPVQMCHSCGHVSRCPRCDANLVMHFQDQRLRCHHCGTEQRMQEQCPSCEQSAMQPVGQGTERIEQVLTQLYPDKQVVRLDKDSTQRKGSLEDLLQQINQGHADIILGTQMLAKGHHFPDVTLVALLDVDSGLFSIDFRSQEKLAQLIIQVAGRAGRSQKPGRVLLQTCHPEHPLLQTLLNEGYQAFSQQALQERQLTQLPPYGFQALFRAQGLNGQTVHAFLQQLIEISRSLAQSEIEILGPVPAPMTRRAGLFRYQLLIQSKQRKQLHFFLDQLVPQINSVKQSKQVKWSLDVDPLDLY